MKRLLFMLLWLLCISALLGQLGVGNLRYGMDKTEARNILMSDGNHLDSSEGGIEVYSNSTETFAVGIICNADNKLAGWILFYSNEDGGPERVEEFETEILDTFKHYHGISFIQVEAVYYKWELPQGRYLQFHRVYDGDNVEGWIAVYGDSNYPELFQMVIDLTEVQ